MAGIIIKMDGLDAVRKKLGDIAGIMSRPGPLLKAIGDRVVEQTKQRFEAGGPAPDGAQWAKPKTPNPKRRGTLRVTDHLRDSIRHQVSGSTLMVGSNKVYAAIHQLGGKAGRGQKVSIPARPYLGLNNDNSDEIIKIIEEFIEVKK